MQPLQTFLVPEGSNICGAALAIHRSVCASHRTGRNSCSSERGTFAVSDCSPTTFNLLAAKRPKVFAVAASETPQTELQASVPAAEAPAIASILSFQLGALVVAALYLAREVLVPIALAILLSFVLAPSVDVLRRWRLGRVPSVLIAVLAAIAVIGVIATVIGSQVAQLAPRTPEYAASIEKKIGTTRNYILEK